VVPEVYRQRFRASVKTRSETYSEFAFRLTTQFKRWCESMNAYSDVAVIRELILMEQFTTHLEDGMRGWLIDQNPKTLSELSRLADQYVAVHVVERPSRGSLNPTANQFVPRHGQGYHQKQKNQEPSKDVGSKVETGNKPQGSPNRPNVGQTGFHKKPIVSFYCEKPGHIMSACHKRQAAKNNEAQSVQLVHLPPGGLAPPTTVSVQQEIDHRYRQHCVDSVITCQDCAKQSVKILRDTGALQSFVSSAVVSSAWFWYYFHG